jgi:hypothetical protein
LLCCIAVAAVGCAGSTPTSSSKPAPIFDEPFMTAYEGCDGTYVGFGTGGMTMCTALHSQAELDAFWASLYSDPVPQVNFDQVWAFAFYAHYCSGCCWGTWEVTSLEETPDCISIEIQHIGCGSECDELATCACTVLVTIPQADKPVCVNGSPAYPCLSP